MNPNSFIDFIKDNKYSRCDVFDCVSNDGYFEIIINDDNSEEESFKVHLNITDITKPILLI